MNSQKADVTLVKIIVMRIEKNKFQACIFYFTNFVKSSAYINILISYVQQ